MISGVNSTGNAPGNQPGINTLWMKRQVIILMFRRNDTECQVNLLPGITECTQPHADYAALRL